MVARDDACLDGLRFYSAIEPMLGAVNLDGFFALVYEAGIRGPEITGTLPGLGWVIVGGETGDSRAPIEKRNARPVRPDWVRAIRRQCDEARVPFFFKGWGEWAPKFAPYAYFDADNNRQRLAGDFVGWTKVGREKSGRLLDGREWSEFPEVKIGAATTREV